MTLSSKHLPDKPSTSPALMQEAVLETDLLFVAKHIALLALAQISGSDLNRDRTIDYKEFIAATTHESKIIKVREACEGPSLAGNDGHSCKQVHCQRACQRDCSCCCRVPLIAKPWSKASLLA